MPNSERKKIFFYFQKIKSNTTIRIHHNVIITIIVMEINVVVVVIEAVITDTITITMNTIKTTTQIPINQNNKLFHRKNLSNLQRIITIIIMDLVQMKPPRRTSSMAPMITIPNHSEFPNHRATVFNRRTVADQHYLNN